MKNILLLLALSIPAFMYAQNVGIGTSTPHAKLDINGDLALREGAALAVSAGSNSIALPSDANSVYRLTGATGPFTIATIAAGNNGSELTLINTTGQVMTIANGSGIITNTGANIVATGTASSVSFIYNTTLSAWVVSALSGFSTSGTVTGVSIATANGLAGTVASPATTPAITLSTTVTGLLKGNGTAISAATAGTDYQSPVVAGTGIGVTGSTISNTGVTSITSAAPMTANTTATGAVTINLTGIVPIANGGTNSPTALSGSSIMVSNGTKIVQGPAGTTTTVLHGNAGAAPAYSAVVLATDVSGLLPIANGGTNTSATPTTGGLAYGTGSAIGYSAAGSSGQVLLSGGTGSPTWSSPTGLFILNQTSAQASSNFNISGTGQAAVSFLVGSYNAGISSDQSGSIELGAGNGVASPTGTVPYIDFHYGIGSVQDYNVRLINDANGVLDLDGGQLQTNGNNIMEFQRVSCSSDNCGITSFGGKNYSTANWLPMVIGFNGGSASGISLYYPFAATWSANGANWQVNLDYNGTNDGSNTKTVQVAFIRREIATVPSGSSFP